MSENRELPDSARIVVIGGGVGGASVAYHLAQLGETDVVVVDRDELTSGSTFHSAGLVGQLRADPTLTRMNIHMTEHNTPSSTSTRIVTGTSMTPSGASTSTRMRLKS